MAILIQGRAIRRGGVAQIDDVAGAGWWGGGLQAREAHWPRAPECIGPAHLAPSDRTGRAAVGSGAPACGMIARSSPQ
ncbi:hypothetical protein NL676_005505 [Syzygium grande]|nr:hypothetical protein NL676_005505 [Syzygium grande]